MESNYFVCTLGEADECTHKPHYQNVNQLLDEQFQKNPDLPAIGFYTVSKTITAEYEELGYEVLTFKQVQQGVLLTAELLKDNITANPKQAVGLLCASSPRFLFTWLACIRLDHPVLLIAPECSAAGIAQLCEDCGVKVLITDDKNAELGQDASNQRANGEKVGLSIVTMPFSEAEVSEIVRRETKSFLVSPIVASKETAYFHHTSGTSSGSPKPIPQSHHGAVGVLPVFDGESMATFTTTPLYHGGPADIFRAWTSNALIWLFPSHKLPITPGNICRCLATSSAAAKTQRLPPICYFATVPYILQMMSAQMSAEKTAVASMQRMSLVSVGGAALSRKVGDVLVREGVKLVSRFGSAECGFLLSSHRDYLRDREWQYLRPPDNSNKLKFEKREEGLYELVVLAGWPHMAKSNREDGSYATSDLFEPHPRLKNAWRYHSRADAQISLVTGKKFDPAPIEDAVVAATSLLAHTLVFGNDKPYPGMLLFRSEGAAEMSDQEIMEVLAPIVHRIGVEGQAHTRISNDMLIPLPFSRTALEKSSKGTILRGRAQKRYAREIESAYDKIGDCGSRSCPDEELPNVITRIVLSSKPDLDAEKLHPTTELYSFGIDSIASIKIRKQLQQLLPEDAQHVSFSVVEDCGCVAHLVDHIRALREGVDQSDTASAEDNHKMMLDLVAKYSNFAEHTSQAFKPETVNNPVGQMDEVVVLTGATGFLGSYVLDLLRSNLGVKHIYCLVRGATSTAAYERVHESLQSRQLSGLEDSKNISVLQARLGDEDLGLDAESLDKIRHEATIVLHLAWSVNFRLKLPSFENDIAGVRNLINLCATSSRTEKPKFVFCSSVASALNHTWLVVPETILDDPSSATSIGYSQSKWVAEQVCSKAAATTLQGRITILRVGQLSGNCWNGVWNMKEAWPLMLSTVKLTGSLPELKGEMLDWLPVDIAAAAVVQSGMCSEVENTLEVFHVMNEDTRVLWQDVLDWLQKRLCVPLEIVTPQHWVKQLENARDAGSQHPALQLLEHWKNSYQDYNGVYVDRRRFSMERTGWVLPMLNWVQPVDLRYFHAIWTWIDSYSQDVIDLSFENKRKS
ncbi:acetyl-CoA synthetase-like protein [Microthyrium microscopicum]|uniref:Acetyl-CoA synthetase-like protein n=1 Tax=Microthyrium microscopicum TaxID=703497 RepID=A0A6A6UF36_9PEZI|nr:acetyl-CoA synthetase-like protein [Microthyrium microscopicum]